MSGWNGRFLVGLLGITSLNNLVKSLDDVFHSLARALKVDLRLVDELQRKHPTDTFRVAFETLVIWKDQAQKRVDTIAMVEDMHNALEDVHLPNVADNIKLGTYCFRNNGQTKDIRCQELL